VEAMVGFTLGAGAGRAQKLRARKCADEIADDAGPVVAKMVSGADRCRVWMGVLPRIGAGFREPCSARGLSI
jgi:hypothetical protein